ncbi:phytanoyl-CoA dioxygenase family protein [Jiangella alkaliphila]|uniref:Ectoine hydroxylase-related dioxygenase, phytanoyl-CoA dioxygenase (PhyH) family n=1 Tax=Jiangella alkaliphila TaxID=419479 RepID=A0A1H2JSP2_9ACTN|nr:phytanoyl-CoA dioxygenase family protein [Jiangella alkaliphila]SDU59191.1 Ectoine hydroxylase-related dioxygenase, phytanoyl-CoA dioxygenase (PhyH) family [Jiangella alkaliphila]
MTATPATTHRPALHTALAELGATSDALTDDQRARLDADGFLALPGLFAGERLAALRARIGELQESEGSAAGHEVGGQRGAAMLADLINKGEVFESVFTEPAVLAAAHHVVGNVRVNSLNFRAALPGEGHQNLHSDWGRPVADGDFHICNSMWLLDDFTADNGATRVVPGSHRWGRVPADDLPDAAAPHPDERLLLGEAGTVVIFNAHVWHGGTLNRTGVPRRGLTMSYSRRDEPQQLDQAAYVRKVVHDRLSPAARFVLDV